MGAPAGNSVARHAEQQAGAGGAGSARLDAVHAGSAHEPVVVGNIIHRPALGLGLHFNAPARLGNNVAKSRILHAVNAQQGHIQRAGSGNGVAGVQPVGSGKVRFGHPQGTGQIVHFRHKSGNGGAAAPAGHQVTPHKGGNSQGGNIVRTQQGGIQSVPERQAVSRLEIHGIARTEAERFLGHGNESIQRQPRAGHPVQSHHGGGYLGKTGHGPFFFCIGTEKKLAGISLNGNITGPFLCLGGKLEYTGQGQKE